jgi:hypothetical protein
MRTVVLDRDLVEGEVKPHGFIEEYLRLLAEDVQERLLAGLVDCVCPGCHGNDVEEAFARSGMHYRHCRQCNSLFVSPRPVAAAIDEFYRNARSTLYWQERILPATRDVRRVKLYRPQAEWLLDVVDEYRPQTESCVVVGYHNELLIEELLAQEADRFTIIVSNPSADIEFSGKTLPGVSIRPMGLGDLGGLAPADMVLAFDLLDRCADPDALFAALYDVLAPGGLLLATTTLGSGFDIQVLWEEAEGVYPPERLNLLSVEGLELLCRRHNFEILEFSTPGMFDVHTVCHAIRENPTAQWPRHIRYLAERRDETALEALQEFLQRFRLSSFGRVALRKNQGGLSVS